MSNGYIQLPLPGGGGGSGVSTLNSLTGSVTLVAGAGISVTPSGQTITIANTAAVGALRDLSNLTSPTAVSQTLNMGGKSILGIGTITIGAATPAFASQTPQSLINAATSGAEISSILTDINVDTSANGSGGCTFLMGYLPGAANQKYTFLQTGLLGLSLGIQADNFNSPSIAAFVGWDGNFHLNSGVNLLFRADGSGTIGTAGGFRPQAGYFTDVVQVPTLALGGAAGLVQISHVAPVGSGDYNIVWPPSQGDPNSVPVNDGSGNLLWSNNLEDTSGNSSVDYQNRVLGDINGNPTADYSGSGATAQLFLVTNFGHANTTTATTTHSVVRKMEIFDASGTSLGFIPIYSSIT